MDETVNNQIRVVPPSNPKGRAGAGCFDLRSARAKLVRLACRFVFDREDAEDVVQEALLKEHEHAGVLRDPSKRWPWLCRVVIRGCHEHGRQKQRKARAQERLATEAVGETVGPPDGSARNPQANELMQKLVGRLPTRQREVIVLRHLQQMSFEEIGVILEITASTARVHAQAGRERLREMMIQNDGAVSRSGSTR